MGIVLEKNEEINMTRICDNCKKTIPLGQNLIQLSFTGIKEMVKLFGVTQLDFCKMECLIIFLTKHEKTVSPKVAQKEKTK